MLKYTDITKEDIDRMTLAELNKYIAEYGKILIQRTQRIYASRESTERTRALKYVSNNLKDIAKNINITNNFDTEVFTGESPELKNFSQIKEARARLHNLVSALNNQRSTITGQKKISVQRRRNTRETLKGYGIKKRFTNKQLDILSEVIAEMGNDAEYEEIIEGYYLAVEEGKRSKEEITEFLEHYFDRYSVDVDSDSIF